MRKILSPRKRLIPVIAAFLVSGWVGVSQAADFSADFIATAPGEKESRGKIYMQGNKMRMEPEAAGGKMVTISRPDKKVVWMVMDDEKMFMEQAYQEDARMQGWTPERQSHAKYVGDETVSGLRCKKYQVDGKQEYTWISDQIGFPVKTEGPNGTMLLENIKVGKVPTSLFEVPPGYQQFSMPAMGSGMPGGMPRSPRMKGMRE